MDRGIRDSPIKRSVTHKILLIFVFSLYNSITHTKNKQLDY